MPARLRRIPLLFALATLPLAATLLQSVAQQEARAQVGKTGAASPEIIVPSN
jgi:hypothetical protein